MSANGVKSLASRRAFLLQLAPKTERRIEGEILDDSHLRGHRLRDGQMRGGLREPRKAAVVIVGGGIAGLCAGWRLLQKGFRDFVILEMEKQAGGNSRWGENEVSAYPWAAHYLPVPNRGSKLVRELCVELGLLHDGEFEERHLCHSPQERLFLHGRWQEGLEPEVGLQKGDREQFKRFFGLMQEQAASGQYTVPWESGAKASALDKVSMEEWLREKGFDSPYVRWYVEYGCRDDYGSLAKDTSAWAGVHYFAAREHEDRGPLTWPEGNGWIVKQLLKKLAPHVVAGAMVTQVAIGARGVRVLTETTDWEAKGVIWAAPSYLLRYVMESAPDTSGIIYSPWITANVTLDRMPRQAGTEFAWDNVIYDSPALGYVVATHQSLRTQIDESVWTWYYPLAAAAPAEGRKQLLARDWAWWREFILNDIGKAHRDIRQCVRRIDLMRFGHAMARPAPGWMFSPARATLTQWGGRMVLANSDLSGLSIFEEAQYRGVGAAERMLRVV